jgi:hypothetical protein
MREGHERESVQRDFLKYTAQMIIRNLETSHPKVLENFKVNAKDRAYQIWKRNPLSIDLYSEKVLLQKLNYIHQNPLKEKWKLVEVEENYEYSSSEFYQTERVNRTFFSLSWMIIYRTEGRTKCDDDISYCQCCWCSCSTRARWNTNNGVRVLSMARGLMANGATPKNVGLYDDFPIDNNYNVSVDKFYPLTH